MIEGGEQDVALEAGLVPPAGHPLPLHNHMQGIPYHEHIPRQLIHTMPVNVVLPAPGVNAPGEVMVRVSWS